MSLTGCLTPRTRSPFEFLSHNCTFPASAKVSVVTYLALSRFSDYFDLGAASYASVAGQSIGLLKVVDKAGGSVGPANERLHCPTLLSSHNLDHLCCLHSKARANAAPSERRLVSGQKQNQTVPGSILSIVCPCSYAPCSQVGSVLRD